METEMLGLDIDDETVIHNTSDDYYTPPFIFEKLGLEFDLDVAGPWGGIPWLPAKKTYTVIDNGLDQAWEGRVWCNPPFSDTAPWARRMLQHGNGIALVPMSKTKWFNQLWANADGVLALPNDMKFKRRSGEEKGIFMPTVLFAFGGDNLAALKSSGLGHVR